MVTSEELKENIQKQDSWTRGLRILVVWIAAQITELMVFAICLLQFLSSLLIRKRFENLDNFSRQLAEYTRDIIRFVTYTSHQAPFPFADWSYDKAEDKSASKV